MTDHPFPRRYDPAKPHQWDLDSAMHMIQWNIDKLIALRDELPGTWARALDWTPGISAGGDVAVSGGRVGDDGAENGRVPTAALARLTDRSSGPAVDFHIILEGMVRNSRVNMRVVSAQKRLRVAEPAPDVLEVKPRAGSGTCSNLACGTYCTGEGDDRIKAGRCPTCYRYWTRNGRTKDRPHEHPVAVLGCKLCERDELIAAGHDPNDVVSLVDGARR